MKAGKLKGFRLPALVIAKSNYIIGINIFCFHQRIVLTISKKHIKIHFIVFIRYKYEKRRG